jgi:hypothetical protein
MADNSEYKYSVIDLSKHRSDKQVNVTIGNGSMEKPKVVSSRPFTDVDYQVFSPAKSLGFDTIQEMSNGSVRLVKSNPDPIPDNGVKFYTLTTNKIQ